MRTSLLRPRLVRRSLISVLVACGTFAAVASVATAVPVAGVEGSTPVGEAAGDVVPDGGLLDRGVVDGGLVDGTLSGGAVQRVGALAVTGTAEQTPWVALGCVVAILVGTVLMGFTLRPEPVLVEMRSLRPIRPVDPRRRRTNAPGRSISS